MRVAVTGGIAEGKSTVVAMLAEYGCSTVSSDQLAREVFQLPDVQPLLARAARLSGDTVSPTQLRAAIAADDLVRHRVNRIMHPRVRARMDAAEAGVHEVPLLFEACLYGRYDQVWVVTCGPEEQLRRLIHRIGNEETARSLIASQLSSEVKVAFADRVIDSRMSVPEMQGYVAHLAQSVLGGPKN